MVKIVAYLSLLFVVSCANYAPPKIDNETSTYPTMTNLSAGAIEQEETNVDLNKYKFVYLDSRTNVYPGRFEFFIREAFARYGFVHVLNKDELTNLVTSKEELSYIDSISDPIAQKKLSDSIGPILYVFFKSRWDGDVRRYVDVTIKDMSTGEVFLKIDHPKLIWWEVDKEAHYPVLNAIKEWVEKCEKHGGSV